LKTKRWKERIFRQNIRPQRDQFSCCSHAHGRKRGVGVKDLKYPTHETKGVNDKRFSGRCYKHALLRNSKLYNYLSTRY
jgi:hypothetical protein